MVTVNQPLLGAMSSLFFVGQGLKTSEGIDGASSKGSKGSTSDLCMTPVPRATRSSSCERKRSHGQHTKAMPSVTTQVRSALSEMVDALVRWQAGSSKYHGRQETIFFKTQ